MLHYLANNKCVYLSKLLSKPMKSTTNLNKFILMLETVVIHHCSILRCFIFDPMHNKVIYKDGTFIHKNSDQVTLETKEGLTNLAQILQNYCRETPDREFLGRIVEDKVEYKTYAEFMKIVKRISKFIENVTEDKDLIGICSVNRMVWLAVEYAGYMINCPNCPLRHI